MKDPAMLFYTSDFLTGVALLSMAERGQYITLLCLQQQHGHMSAADIRAAVGKVSARVLEKFRLDESGKYYNARAELEIQKRAAHSQKQRENVLKRWNKEDNSISIPQDNHGNTVVSTTVLPLENGSGNRNRKIKEQDGETFPARAGEDPDENDPELAAFFSALYENLGPLSRGATDEALAWYKASGGPLCLHAVDVALDNGKRSWSYVRAVLSRWERDGLRSLQAVQAEEKAREAKGKKKASAWWLKENESPIDLGDLQELSGAHKAAAPARDVGALLDKLEAI